MMVQFADPDRGESDSVKMSDSQRFQLGTVGALSLSVVSSVSIVICNKALISSLGFSFGQWFMPSFSFSFFF